MATEAGQGILQKRLGLTFLKSTERGTRRRVARPTLALRVRRSNEEDSNGDESSAHAAEDGRLQPGEGGLATGLSTMDAVLTV